MQRLSELKPKIVCARQTADRLRRIRPRTAPRYEIGAYIVLPLILIMAGAMPTSGLVLMPFALALLYLLYRRFDAPFPFAVVCGYGGVSLALNYDILTVVYFTFLLVALCGLILSAQLKPYLLCVTVAAVFVALGFFAGAGIVRLASGARLNTVAEQYVTDERDDPIIAFAARLEYDSADLPAGVEKLDRGDKGYDDETVKYLSSVAADTVEEYLLYYCLHFGAVIGGIAYFFSVMLNKRTASAEDICADEKLIALSTRALGGARRELNRVADMRVPRAFLWSCLLPAFVAGVILEIVGGFDALSATIMHAFVTLPASFAFITLMCYFASLFRGKGRVAAYIVFGILCVASVISPTVLFFGSMIGVCDILLNLRFWTEFLMSD